MKKQIHILVLAGAMAMATASAFAQMDAGPMGRDGMHRDPAKMAQIHARHLTELKAKLKITPNQEAAWTAFTESMKPPANPQMQRPDRAELDKLPTPERIDKMRALRKEHMAAMEAEMDKREEATKTFYAALTPEQQKVFDAEHARMDKRFQQGRRMPPADPNGKPQPPKQ